MQLSSLLDEVPATALQYWCRERLKKLEYLQLLLQLFHLLFVRQVHLVRLLRLFRWEQMQGNRTIRKCKEQS